MTVPIGNQTVVFNFVTLGAPDSLGVRQKNTTTQSVNGCSFQPASTSETLGDIDQTTSLWHLYAPPLEELTPVDSITTPWDGLRYDIVGDAQIWTDSFGRASHLELLLRRATG